MASISTDAKGSRKIQFSGGNQFDYRELIVQWRWQGMVHRSIDRNPRCRSVDFRCSRKALAKLKADHAKEPEIVKQITLIEKHHAKAHDVCGMAEEHCLKEHGDHVAVADCCTDMWSEIDAAQVETKKLLKMLKIEKLPIPKKVTDKKTEKKAEAKTEKKEDK